MQHFQNFSFYTVDPDYLAYLYHIDSEVYFSESYRKKTKPFVGILVGIEEFNYFIPLSSAKSKHLKWKNYAADHIIVHELIEKGQATKNQLIKPYNKTYDLHLLSILDFKKMIPAPEGFFEVIDFDTISNQAYKFLLLKEYVFLEARQEKVLKNAVSFYNKQKTTKRIYPATCNFERLEQAMQDWIDTMQK